MLSRLLAILKLMGKNRYLRNVVAPMKDKFGDNWSIIQMFYSFAFFLLWILEPRKEDYLQIMANLTCEDFFCLYNHYY
jgi:hypothetical protein